jgi:uncharacterized protein YdaU (DUF1376 family)
MSDIVYVRYYPNSMLSCGGQLSPLAELAHRRMCDALWARNESLPNEEAWLARVARVTPRAWQGVKRELVTHGWCVRRNRWTHPEAMAVLRSAQELHASASAHAKRAALGRWEKCPGNARASDPGSARARNSKTVSTVAVRTSHKIPERSEFKAQDAGNGSDKETRFMADVAAVISTWSPKEASGELTNWGGWWRNRYRENPRKSQKVLAEIKGMILEHRIRRSPGAASRDLWKRLP